MEQDVVATATGKSRREYDHWKPGTIFNVKRPCKITNRTKTFHPISYIHHSSSTEKEQQDAQEQLLVDLLEAVVFRREDGHRGDRLQEKIHLRFRIYRAREFEKRTYANIGEEFGLSVEATRQHAKKVRRLVKFNRLVLALDDRYPVTTERAARIARVILW